MKLFGPAKELGCLLACGIALQGCARPAQEAPSVVALPAVPAPAAWMVTMLEEPAALSAITKFEVVFCRMAVTKLVAIEALVPTPPVKVAPETVMVTPLLASVMALPAAPGTRTVLVTTAPTFAAT